MSPLKLRAFVYELKWTATGKLIVLIVLRDPTGTKVIRTGVAPTKGVNFAIQYIAAKHYLSIESNHLNTQSCYWVLQDRELKWRTVDPSTSSVSLSRFNTYEEAIFHFKFKRKT